MAIEDSIHKARNFFGATLLTGVIAVGSSALVINHYRPDLVSQKAADAAMVVVDYQMERHPNLMKPYKNGFVDYAFEIPGAFSDEARERMHGFTIDNLTQKEYKPELLELSKLAAQKYPSETIQAYSNDQLVDEYTRRMKEKSREFWESIQNSDSYQTLRDAFLKLMY